MHAGWRKEAVQQAYVCVYVRVSVRASMCICFSEHIRGRVL